MSNVIEFRAYDLYIGEVNNKETGLIDEVVRIKGQVAFDPDFIEEMKLKGVKKYDKIEKQEG